MRPFDQYTPVGVINHHTAGSAVLVNYPDPPYYPDSSLREKCNLTIRPDGEVHVLNAGWAYDSGNGSRDVLAAVLEDEPLPSLDGLVSDVGGNQWFIDAEVQHLGDGSPIEPRQREALITANAVICRHFGWDPRFRVIGHREWAPDRKPDPRWDGNANPMPTIRADTFQRLEESMKEKLYWWSRPAFEWAIKRGLYTEASNVDEVRETNEFQRVIVFYHRFWRKIVRPAIAGAGVTAAAVIEEIVRRLAG